MSSVHLLEDKLEDTVKTFLENGNLDGSPHMYVYGDVCGLGESISEPYVSVRCPDATPGIPEVELGSGQASLLIVAEIAIRTHASDVTDEVDYAVVLKKARNAHADLVGSVLDMFYRTDIVAALNIATSSVKGIGIDAIDQPVRSREITDRSYITTLKFPILCHPNAEE